MGQRQPAQALLELDAHMTARVRVRRWRHLHGEVPRWPVGAHQGVEVAWSERGALSYQVGRETLHAAVGDVVVVPAQIEHRTRITEGTVATSIRLNASVVAEVAEMMGCPAKRLTFDVVHGAAAVISLGSMMLEEANAGERGAFLTTDALAEALAVRLIRSAHPGEGADAPVEMRGTDPRIARAIGAVEDRYADALTVDDLAQAAGMSRFHFSRMFRAQIGKSPYQYLVATRVRRAAELLRRKRCSVTEAAYCVGFNDLGRFARAFRRQMGCPPSAYA